MKAAKALKEKGETPEELLRSIKENEAAVAEAQRVVDAWKAIVGEESRREEAAKAEAERIATEKAEAERKAAEERERAEAEEKTRIEAENKEAERIAAEKAEEEARVEAERKAEEEAVEKDAELKEDKKKPQIKDVVKTIYEKGKAVASKLFGRSFFDVAKTPDFMKKLGLTGDRFTIKYGVLSRHAGKDASHLLTEKQWEELPDAIQKPFAITRFGEKENGYRLYTTMKNDKGETIVVGVDVKNIGRNLEVNSISTIFGRRGDAKITQKEEVLYTDEKITPEQRSLLGQPNSDQYTDTRERNVSADKGSEKPEKKQEKQSVFDKAKEIADKEEKKRKAEAEDDSVIGQATRAVGKKKKVNLFKYTASQKDAGEVMKGVHYANGYAYASDGYILFKEKADYPKEWEGTTRDKDSNLIDGKYPDAEKAIPRLVHIPDKEVESLPSKEVLDFAIAASKKLKGEAIPVAIDGLFFNAVNLKKFLEAVASKGMDKVVYRHPMLYATNGKDEIIMMPIVNTLEGALDIADKMESAGLPKEQIDAWKAHIEAADKKMSLEDFKKAVENAKKKGVRPTEQKKKSVRPTEAERPKQKELTEAERELRDNLVERMRKGGLDVVTDSEEMQRVIDTENERTRNKRSKKSEAARKRDEALYAVDWSTAFVSGKSREEAAEIRRERGRKFKEETKELYGRVLSGNFDDVTLRLIDKFVDKSTPNNPYERPISKRLPMDAEVEEASGVAVDEEDGELYRDGELERVNEEFNNRLSSLAANRNQKDRVLKLGRPSRFLIDGGVTDAEIILEFDKLARKSDDGYKNEHPFDVMDVENLPLAIAYPIAVFDNTNGYSSGKVILTELEKDGRNFIVVVQTISQRRKGGVVLEVNRIDTLFPKEERGIVNWFNKGLASNIDKEKALRFIKALPNHPGTITKEELLSATKEVKNFEFSKSSDVDRLVGALKDKTDFELYNRLAGEVEARNTEKRIGMTEEERRASLASETEDVAREDQILLRQGLDGIDIMRSEAAATPLKGDEALTALDSIFGENEGSAIPPKISSFAKFKNLFKKPVRTFLGELVQVKDEVWNKILRNNRQDITGTVLPTIENADFAIRDTDGSTLYVKRFKGDGQERMYNVVVVNKHGEVEDYISSVHIKRDNNLRNKIKKGAELFLPNARTTDGTMSRNNSTPGAKVANYSETAKPRYSRKPGESIFDYASRVSEDVDRSVREIVSARDEYEKKVKSKGFQTKEALQNSMLGLQEFMSAIDHASGNKRYIEDIPDFENPILGENRLSSVNKEESHSRLDAVHSPMPTKGVRKPYLRSYTMIYMPLADIFFPRMYQAPDGFMAVRIADVLRRFLQSVQQPRKGMGYHSFQGFRCTF